MKKQIITLSAALAIAALTSCNVPTKTNSDSNDTPDNTELRERAKQASLEEETESDLYSWLSERKVGAADLQGKTAGDLRLMRNAIFARHGYIFKSSDLTEYFSTFAWYHPTRRDVTPYLSQIEKDNIAYIEKYEGGGKSVTAATTSGNPGYRSRLRNVGLVDDYSDIMCNVRLSGEDLEGLSRAELRILRNTIYARHGRRFKSADLDRYFRSFSWYTPRVNEVSESELSSIEKHNISLISAYE